MMREKQLRQHIDKCIDKTQVQVDLLSAKAISKFRSDTNANYEWLNELSEQYSFKNQVELQKYLLLKKDYIKKLEKLDYEVSYFEKLADELDEFYIELSCKLKNSNMFELNNEDG